MLKGKTCILFLFIFMPMKTSALEPFHGLYKYKLNWNGVAIGSVLLNANQSENAYEIEAKVKLGGVAKLVSNHKSTTRVSGEWAENPAISARKYISEYTHRKTNKSIELSYEEGGIISDRKITPPDDPSSRPAIEAKDTTAVADPLSFLHVLRQKIDEARKTSKNSFTLQMYDGKRLTKAEFSALGKEMVGNKKVIRLGLKRSPIKGYTQKELKRFSESGERNIELIFSDDEHLTLLSGRMEAAIGWIGVELAQ